MTNARKVVVKHRNGGESEFDPKVLQSLLNTLSREMKTEHLDLDGAIGKVSSSLPDTVTTEDLTKLVAETLASMTTRHYQYSELASKVLSAHLQKGLPKSFSENFARIFNYKFGVSDSADSMVLSPRVYKTVQANSTKIDEQIAHDRDYDIDYFGLRTLMCSYLIRLEGVLAETPQFMFMRVALGIHYDNIEKALQTYELMSKKYFIHASPTLFNSGLEASNLSSCFLLSMKDDSIDGIFKTLYDTAMISKSAGGIGINISNIRSRGSYIKGTSGISSGLVPLLKVFNSTANYVDQGGNKRPGAFCMYLEPWHGDVFEFLDLRKNHGKEEMRARDLFLALWIPDLFMEKVEKDLDWYLFSPDKCPGLNECYGNKFNDLYERYIEKNMFIRKVRARELWHAILVSQTETGNPFLLYKDRCNVLSNQKNLGVIKGSNLCCEIIEYSSKDETAVCNLASVALPTFVGNGTFNFQKLHEIAKIVIENLDKVIDINQYPLENCKQSNMKHRPVGLGIQGLADVFFKLRFPFDSTESKKINIKIFETIYHAALEASCELAKKYGKYESYEGSPVSRGLLQFDLCKVQPSNLWDWDLLREKIKKYGVRNSLLVALMPTATTSQILGFNECFEPITSNIYIRRVLSGEYQVVNKYLVDDLDKLGLWNIEIKNKIIEHNGSIQNIAEVPDGLKDLYKTVWELSQKTIIDLAADRGPFVDQSQSMNLFLDNVTFSKLTSMHFYAWKKGLKTGMYYLRTKAAASAIQFSLDPSSLQVTNVKKGAGKRVRILKDGESEIENSPHKVVKANATNDEYDIFNTTIVSCNLRDPDGCESCSA